MKESDRPAEPLPEHSPGSPENVSQAAERMSHVETKIVQARARAHVALLDWLKLETGTRDGHDLAIVTMMSELLSSRRLPP